MKTALRSSGLLIAAVLLLPLLPVVGLMHIAAWLERPEWPEPPRRPSATPIARHVKSTRSSGAIRSADPSRILIHS